MTRIIRSIILAAALSFVALPLPAAFAASGDKVFSACDQVPNTGTSPICKDKNTNTNPVIHVIHVAADIVALMAGLAAVIMIIVNGITLMTSAGNQESVARARKSIVNAIIGLIVVSLAWVIVSFVTSRLIK